MKSLGIIISIFLSFSAFNQLDNSIVNEELQVFPNPANDFVTIHFPE